MQLRYSMALGAAAALSSLPLLAADLQLKLEIPRLTVAEYHRPYLAVWIETADQSLAGNLAVWYEVKNKNNEGTKWLKDMRSWWRKSGRDLSLPADGLSSATRAPGEHSLSFPAAKSPLDKLPPGDYQLVVETVREVGGRELVKVPFSWPAKAAATTSAKGEHELGAISVTVTP
ncbi:MAG TPA: DUF2271 domain-containing protein [Ideonella sp.]|nr:DUF2271 domain-containing protein [Ideonella sp.]